MNRKNFLKRGLIGLGTAVVLPSALTSCSKDDATPGECDVTASETAGPFPIKTPASLVRTDITEGKAGVELLIDITVKDQSNNCAALEGALVDIWHCDAQGYYSEYSNNAGGGVQDNTAVHFLRGRATTNADGLAKFTSIFPGWYPGRAPHIHVHIYNGSGASLLVTQIAFPKNDCDTVYTTDSDYTSHGTQDTLNETDNVFSDSLDEELGIVTGSVGAGYLLTKEIVVA